MLIPLCRVTESRVTAVGQQLRQQLKQPRRIALPVVRGDKDSGFTYGVVSLKDCSRLDASVDGRQGSCSSGL